MSPLVQVYAIVLCDVHMPFRAGCFHAPASSWTADGLGVSLATALSAFTAVFGTHATHTEL